MKDISMEKAIQTLNVLKYVAEERIADDGRTGTMIYVDLDDVNALNFALAWLRGVQDLRRMMNAGDDMK